MKNQFLKIIIILFFIVLLGSFLRLYKLDNMSFVADEYLGVNATYGHKQTGEWKFWDWNNNEIKDKSYTRAQVYYWQVSSLLDHLPPTEKNFRLISVFWGILTIILMFFVSYFFTRNYWIALLSSLLWSISITAISFDRHFRMYSMFTPVYLALSFFTYQLLESSPKKIRNFIDLASQKTKLNWNFLLPFLGVFVLSFLTHLLTINILPTIFIYLLLLAIIKWKKENSFRNKYFYLLIFSLLGGLAIYFFNFLPEVVRFIKFPNNHFKHLENITLDYNSIIISMTFVVFGIFFIYKKNQTKSIWLTTSFFVPLLLAIFMWNRNPGDQYIYFIQTFQVILIASGIYFIAKKTSSLLKQKKLWVILGLILYFLVILYNFNFFTDKNSFYQKNIHWDNPNYREVFDYYKKKKGNNAILITRDFRNYYYSNLNTPVFDFGGENKDEEKLTLEKLKKVENEHNEVWIIISTNDHSYIKSDTRHYIRQTYENIDFAYKNNSIEIWKKIIY